FSSFWNNDNLVKNLTLKIFSGLSMNLYKGALGTAILTFGELEFLTGFLLSEFLTFHHSRISGQQTFWFQGKSVLSIQLYHGSGDSKTNSLSLSCDPTTVDVHFNVKVLVVSGHVKRLSYFIL